MKKITINFIRCETIKTEKSIEIEEENCFLRGQGFLGGKYFIGVFRKDCRTHRIKMHDDEIEEMSLSCGSFQFDIQKFCQDKEHITKISKEEFFNKVKNKTDNIIKAIS